MDDCSQRAVTVQELRRRAEGATPATVADRFDQVVAAFNELWDRCAQAVARAVSGRWAEGLAQASYESDDALSVLEEHLWAITPRFNPVKAQFSTWWGTCAKRRVWALLPQRPASPSDEVGSQDHGQDGPGCDDCNEEHTAGGADFDERRSSLLANFQRFVEDYLRGVSNRQLRARTRDYRIFYLKAFNGESTSRLAQHFGVTDQVVSQASARVQTAFADWILEQDPDGWGALLKQPASGGGR